MSFYPPGVTGSEPQIIGDAVHENISEKAWEMSREQLIAWLCDRFNKTPEVDEWDLATHEELAEYVAEVQYNDYWDMDPADEYA